MDISRLRPFGGLHSSLLAFSTGYVFRISYWFSTPTEFGAFSNVWMVTPQDRHLLFADPAKSGRVVRIYHRFVESYGATISLWRPDPMCLHLVMQGSAATTIEINLRLGRTLLTRVLAASARAMPVAWATKDTVAPALDALTSMFIAKGRVRVAGKTETEEPYFAGDIDDIMLVKDGSASVNGGPAGYLCPATRPVAFGGFQATPQALELVGRLYLAYRDAGAANGGP